MASMKWWGLVPLALILYAVGCKAQCVPACVSTGATCMIDAVGNYTCKCNAGYTGDTCDDSEPPQFEGGTCPPDIDETAEAMMSVKMLTWTDPSANDTTGVDPAIECTPQSGSNFTIGTHDVICTATDAAGNQATTNCTFTVTVTDENECEGSPSVCDMKANCTNIPGSYECSCRDGYTGNGLDQNQLTCTECDEGKYGLNCASECSCVSRGTCNKVTGQCTCDPDFSGTVCDKDNFQVSLTRADGMIGPVDDTENNDDVELICTLNVLPVDLAGSVLIRYPDGSDYTTTLDSNQLVYRKTVTDVHPRNTGDYTCLTQIQPTSSGSIIDKTSVYTLTIVDVDECATNVDQCDVNADCVNENIDGGYNCVCNPGYRLADDGVTCDDIDECTDDTEMHDCVMNADCSNTDGSFICTCKPGFFGTGDISCQECDEGKYGLNCASECSCVSRGTCNKVTGQCTCDPDFSGTVCDKDDLQVTLTRADGMTGPVDDTENNDDVELICTLNVLPVDLAGSVLIRYPDGSDYTTTRDPNQLVYRKTVTDVHPRNTGDYTCLTQIQPRPSKPIIDKTSVHRLTVVDVDECATNVDQCDVNAYCVNENMDGGYNCVCYPGYRFADDGVTCVDIDECTDGTVMHDCVMNADCSNTDGSFNCTCKPGFSGTGDSSCQVCMQGNYGLACAENCTCVAPVRGGNDVICNNVGGTCSCNQEFTGKACDKLDLNVVLTADPYPVLDTKGVDNVTLNCSINLHSRDLVSVDITFQNGTQITDTTLHNSSEGRYERTLYDITLEDSAMYRCTATAMINEALIIKHGDVNLDVLAPGRIISVTEKVEGELGTTITVDCIVYADPAPNITWYDPDLMVIINDDMKYTVSSTTDQGQLTSSLIVKNLVRNDNGSYKCETQNDLTDDVDEKFAEVFIIEVPEVGNVVTTPVSSESIDVTWTVTYNGNLPFTCRVEYREAITGMWETSTPNPPQQAESHRVTGLEAFTSYSIQVTCNNKVGDGLSSTPVNQVKTKQAAPSAPRNPTVTEYTFESLTVAWEEPEMKRGTIAFYRVSVESVSQTYRTPGPGNPAPLSLLVSGLKPFTDYNLFVTAFNMEDGSSLMGQTSVEITEKTAESIPTFPVNVVLNDTGKTCIVTWDRPLEENGIILTYTISRIAHFYPTAGTNNDLVEDTDKTDEVEVKGDQMSYSIDKIDLVPYARYRFAINASTTVGKGAQSEVTVTTCDSPPSAPPEPSMPSVAMVEERVTDTSFWMALENASSTFGPISCYDIIVVRIEKNAEFTYKGIDPDMQYPQSSIMTYEDSLQKAGAYRAVVKNGKRLPKQLQIGVTRTSTCDDDNSSSRRKKRATPGVRFGDNGPLWPETRYSAFLRAFVKLNDGSEVYSSSPLMEPITTAPGASIVGPIVGVILAILIIVVIVLMFLIYKRQKEMPLLRDRENGFSMEPVLGREKELEVTHMVVLPIAIEELPEKVQQKSQNEDEVFKSEFKSIPEATGAVTRDASQLECNKEKNRYINITAYDRTRVKLMEIKGVEGSDYINACYVDGYGKPKKFIAAQGPREDTVIDFWRMIWEQNCSTVIMLTKCLENGREKCAEYWPEEDAIMYDDIIVTLDDVVTCADYVIRKFTMQKSIEGEDEDDEPVLGESRILMQFHFLGWPDFGVPKYPHSLLCFIKRIRHMSGNRTDPGNTVIHCSAGVGRTGTYILIDSMLDMMKKEKKVDIYNVIYSLRNQRNLLVQSLVQYILIHKALAEEYLFGHTEVDVGSLHILFQKLSKKDPDSDFTGLDQEYRTLASLPVENKDQKGGNIEANKHKNRLRQVIPYDFNRVKLERLTGQEHSNYINASFIDGYEHKKAYIAAQGPLPNTMGDFWRLAWENQCSTIVMMSECEEKGQPICCKYWPEKGDTVNHAFLTVTVKDEKEKEDFTIRDLEVSTTKGGGTKLIRQYHFHGWPEVGSPETAASLIKVMGLVYDYQHDIGRFPILVHCSAGSGRTGVFVALSFLLQRAKAEGIVDIFQTVRSLRQQRPHMVQDLEQYQFCYRAMLEYLDSFDHYANFK